LAGVFAVFFLLGTAGLVPVVWQAVRDYRVAKVYVGSEAEIIQYIPINFGYDSRPGKRVERTHRPSFVFRFQTKDGQTITTRGYDAYGGREAPASEWNLISEGDRVPCWYDPASPKKAVLSKRFNPHFYWLLAWPLGIMGFTGLLLRECFRRAVPPTLKGVEKGRRLAWRLPTAASQRAMTGCLGVFMILSALLTSGFTLAALDYQDKVEKYRFISSLLGFNMNGWYWVAFAAAAVTLLFLWAFLVNLRWIALPEPEVEISATELRPGQTGNLYVRQAGPLKAHEYTVSLVCEINGIPGKPPARKEVLLERKDLRVGDGREGEAVDFSMEFSVPRDAKRTCKSVPMKKAGSSLPSASPDLVSWFIRIERRVSAKTVLTSDYEVLVVTGTASA
jgi:hypothetical protein